MAFVPIPGGIEGVIKLVNSTTGQRYVNVYHFFDYRVGGPNAADVDAAANWLSTVLWPVYRPVVTANIKLLECTARNISVVSGYEKTDTTNTGQAGTASGDALPGNAACAISWRTSGTGRRNRGRSYVSGLSEEHVGGDRIDTVLLAAMFQIGAALIGSNINSEMYFAVRSIADVAMKVVTGFVQDTVMDSMRTRLLNRGT